MEATRKQEPKILRISHDFIFLLSWLAARWELWQTCQRQNDRDNENNDFNHMAVVVYDSQSYDFEMIEIKRTFTLHDDELVLRRNQ